MRSRPVRVDKRSRGASPFRRAGPSRRGSEETARPGGSSNTRGGRTGAGRSRSSAEAVLTPESSPVHWGAARGEPRAPGRWQRVYSVVALVPPRRVATYGQIAVLAGLGRGARQVGYALHALPPGTAVPWQRVINSRGEISLRRAGGHEATQRIRLEQEGVRFDSRGRVDLDEFGWDGPGVRRARSARARSRTGET